jgi:hypothetical protein
MKKSGWSSKTKAMRKVGTVMHEFKEGTLHSGKSDKIVKNPKQAIAIALSEAGLSKKATGGGVGDYELKDLVDFYYGRKGEEKVVSGTITDILNDGYTISTGFTQVMVKPNEIVGYSKEAEPKKKRFGIFKEGGAIDNRKKNMVMESLIDDDIDFRNDSYPYFRDEELTKIAKSVGYEKNENVANSLGEIMYFDLQKIFLQKYNGTTYKSGAFKDGGGVGDENKEMVLNNNKQIAHHTEEMKDAVKNSKHVPAWVVAKVNRSASDLSDATHYMEGENETYAYGGGTKSAFNSTKEKMKDRTQQERIDSLIEFVSQSNWSSNPITVKDNMVIVFSKMYDLEPTRVASIFNKYQKQTYADGGGIEGVDINDWDMPVIRSQFEEEEFEFGNGGGIYSRTMKTPDGNIIGKVQYNDFWKTYQVVIDGVVEEEFKTKEEAIENLKNAGFDKMALGGSVKIKKEGTLQDGDHIQYELDVHEIKPTFNHKLYGTIEMDYNDNYVATYMNEMYDEREYEKTFDSFEKAEKWVMDKINKDKNDYIKDFGSKMALGGGIPNNYLGKGADEVWNDWTETQRMHFLLDHQIFELHPSKVMISFKELPPKVRIALIEHISEGQYGEGGGLDLNDWDMPVIRSQFEEEEYEYGKGGGVEDKLPPAKIYGENLGKAIEKFNINESEARKRYGNFTISQWKELLGDSMKTGGGVGNEIAEIKAKIEKAKKNTIMPENLKKQYIEKYEKQLSSLILKQGTKEDVKNFLEVPKGKTPKIVKVEPKGKVKIKEILIHWAEGDNSKYDKFPKKYKTWESANKAIIPIYEDNTKDGIDGGYNKVKFTVTFDDNENYDGRLDVSMREDNPTQTHNVIGQHIKDYLDYQLSEKSRTSEESKKEIIEWLEKYDLGLEKSKQIVTKKSEPKSVQPTVDRTPRAIAQDKKRPAKKAGKRISESGNTYYESRENRSDKNPKTRLEKGGALKGWKHKKK